MLCLLLHVASFYKSSHIHRRRKIFLDGGAQMLIARGRHAPPENFWFFRFSEIDSEANLKFMDNSRITTFLVPFMCIKN